MGMKSWESSGQLDQIKREWETVRDAESLVAAAEELAPIFRNPERTPKAVRLKLIDLIRDETVGPLLSDGIRESINKGPKLERTVAPDGSVVLTSRSANITNIEELLAHARDRGCAHDLETYQITDFKENVWTVTAKIGDELVPADNWQVYAKFGLKRPIERVQVFADQAKADILADLATRDTEWFQRQSAVQQYDEPHLLEMHLADFHLCSLAWAEETGADWDLTIQRRMFREAVEDLLAKASRFDVDQILWVAGNDFFNSDNIHGTTADGTPQDMDTRHQKMFREGQRLNRWAIDRCRAIAPVIVKVIPGNHDPLLSFALGEVLEVAYDRVEDVQVDNSASPRKYLLYGNTLLGFTHGRESAVNQKHYGEIMATEARQLWAQARYCEFHIGDKHHRKGTTHVLYDDAYGVVTRIMPTLSAPSAWANGMGYKSYRGAEAYLWSQERGQAAMFVHNVEIATDNTGLQLDR
ncbi:hypothetical protein LCGC14_0859900 [marine sediment metagenome]|uniref:Calcineurin-like phosphoesterase domain-containing protein n=1 Tax=marine sediment metagenome TaxID=412755 RepID=A0A0F9P7Q2_9ZZZZ